MDTNKFFFFSKEGYPHNFQYNKNTKSWEGKIIFDENSDQTFKTQSLHIFENVDSTEFNIEADLINLNYNNNSGLTIAGETNYKNELITNIVKVNESSDFYSKWIYGNNFHKKFPTGTIISFSGLTGDFNDDNYFTVLTVKKNAFLITTNTRNDIFDFTYIPSGYTSSLNMISINEYDRNLSTQPFFKNLHTGKKLSILNSDYNTSVISVKQSGTTNSYLNELKLNGVVDQIFTLKTQLFTERPKISFGDLILRENKYLKLGKSSSLLAPEIYYTPNGTGSTKKEIIFEDINGNKIYNGYTFTVDSLVTTQTIGTKTLTFKKYRKTTNNSVNQWNTIQYDGYLDIFTGFILSLSGLTGNEINQNREFNITNVVYNIKTNSTIMFTPDYIIEEKNSKYNLIKSIQPHQIDTVSVSSYNNNISEFNNVLIKDAYCYSISNIFNLSQIYVNDNSGSTNSNTIDTFINSNKSTLYHHGIDIYHTIKNNEDYLSIESLYGTENSYFYVSGYTNSVKIADNFSLTNNGLTRKYNIITNEKLYSEKTNKSDKLLYNNNIPTNITFNLVGDNDRFGFRLTLNGNEYYTDFYNNTQSTIDNFVNIYGSIFYKNGFIISNISNTLNIESDVDIWQLEVLVNILSNYDISDVKRNNAILLSGNEIKSLNKSLFDLDLSTGMIIKLSGSNFSQNNKEYNIIDLTNDTICLSYQGVFNSDSNINLNVKSREFIRKPRGEFDKDTYLRVYWDTPTDNIIDDSIFLYDISGEQLVPYNNNDIYKYIGQKPLIDSTQNIVNLNKDPNSDISKISNPRFQQTIFNDLIFKLEQPNSSINYNWNPEPLEIYIGYNSNIEGVNNRTLKIEKIIKLNNNNEYFSYSGYTNSGTSMSIPNFMLYDDTIEYLAPINFSFLSYGFKKDQLIKLHFKDKSKYGQRIFENTNIYKILNVNRNKITIDSNYSYLDNSLHDPVYTYSSGFTNFTTTGTTFYFKIEVQPSDVLYCPIYGQTENEDIRYKVNLNNLGIQSEDDVYQILYSSDIQDNAIDYTLFNRKRKEMLSSAREIYDYIGSYKALINSINYFGYNDLQLYEYYKNMEHWNKYHENLLHKVLIPDIFDNTVKGWNSIDFIAGKYQNDNDNDNIIWQKTNLFNLAYRITNTEGDNVLIYSLEEVQFKLTKLKNWLRRNVIPISANLLDITGVVDTTHTLYQNYDESNRTIKSVVDRKSTVVNFNYTASLNFDMDYLITVNFYVLSGLTGSTIDNNDVPLSFSAKIKTFYLSGNTETPTDILTPVQYFKILKNDLTSFSFNINKNVDPYIYIETTTYDNSGNGLGYVNNKLFYFDEPRNHWLVNNNFDLTKMLYWQTTDYLTGSTIEIITPKLKDIHIFVDNNGNVNQIEKESKERLKYYIEEEIPEKVYCVIGVDDEESGTCSEGTALGIGDNLMAFAIYS